MERKDFPNAAFGYVSDDGAYRMLLHHDPDRVKTGKEHGTVDPMLLFAALCLVESIPISEEKRDRVRSDLQAHADVLFAFENDGSPAPDFKLWEDEDTGGLPIAMHDKLRDFAFFKANMDGASETPPVQTEGRGSAYIAYNKRTKEMSWWIQHLDLVAAENAAHFHIGRSGKPGPIEIPLELGNLKNGSQILSADQEKALFEGNMFVNIHSAAYPAGEIRGQVFPTVTSRGNQSEHPVPKSGGKGKKDKNGKKDKMKAEQVTPPSEPNPQPQFQENIQIEPDRRSGDGGPGVSKPPADIRLNPDRGGGPDVSKPPKDEKPQPNFQENVSVEKDRKSGDGGPSVVKPSSMETPQATMVAPEPTASQKPTGGGPEVTTPPEEVTPQPQVRQTNFPIYSKDLYTSESGFVDFGRPLLNVMVDGDSPIFGDETTRNVIENGNSTGAPNQPKISVSKLRDDVEISAIVEANRKEGKKAIAQAIESHLREQKFSGRLTIFPSQSGKSVDMSIVKVQSSAQKSDLPDVAFAVIERGGKRDAQGRTKPQNLRHLPHHTGAVQDGSHHDTVDLPRLRNALARMNQIKAGTKDTDARIQRIAKSHLIRHAKAKLPTSKFAKSDQCRLSDVIAELDEAILQLAGSGAIYVNAKLMEVSEESIVKLFRLKMGDEASPDTFFVRVRFDENANARWIEFDFDTILPARTIPDFTKFLKSLPQEK